MRREKVARHCFIVTNSDIIFKTILPIIPSYSHQLFSCGALVILFFYAQTIKNTAQEKNSHLFSLIKLRNNKKTKTLYNSLYICFEKTHLIMTLSSWCWSNSLTKLSGNMPDLPLAATTPCHQPPVCFLMFVIIAPFTKFSSSGSLAW